MRGRTILWLAVFAGGVEVWGCSSSNSGTSSTDGGAGSLDAGFDPTSITYVVSGACDGRNKRCLPLVCSCTDGTTHETQTDCNAGQCVDQLSQCPKLCGAAGVADAGPLDTVIGSPECNAYCAKAAECGPSYCDPLYDCALLGDRCDASMRAFLQCVVDTGTWTCTGSSLVVMNNCSDESNLCAGDGG